MGNDGIWDWNNGDERIISSVYRDEEDASDEIKASQADIETDIKAESDKASEIKSDNMKQQEPVSDTPGEISKNSFIIVEEPVSDTSQTKEACAKTAFQPVALSQNVRQQYESDEKAAGQRKNLKYQKAYDDKDISENKIAALAAYILGILGIITALLMSAESPYAKFHICQALKITICSAVLGMFAVIFLFLSAIPFVGIIFKLMFAVTGAAWFVVLILRLIAIFQVCDGEAREPAIIKSINFFQ